MKSILDIHYYPDLRNEIKKIRSLVVMLPTPISNTKKKEVLKQVNKKLFIEDMNPSEIIDKVSARIDRQKKYVPSLSKLDIFASSKKTFIEALKGEANSQEWAIIKYLQTYYEAMYKRKAFHSMREFDKKYRGFEISLHVIPVSSKLAIVMIGKYMQWKSYLHSTIRKAYALVGLDGFGNTFVIFIHYGIANSIIKSGIKFNWVKYQKRIWGCKIDYQIGRYGLAKIDRPMNWNYKVFSNVDYLTPLLIQRFIKDGVNCIKIGNEFFQIINPKDEFGKIDSYEIINQE